jgi:hypothetical protein
LNLRERTLAANEHEFSRTRKAGEIVGGSAIKPIFVTLGVHSWLKPFS